VIVLYSLSTAVFRKGEQTFFDEAVTADTFGKGTAVQALLVSCTSCDFSLLIQSTAFFAVTPSILIFGSALHEIFL